MRRLQRYSKQQQPLFCVRTSPLQALEAKQSILELHEAQPFLDPKEKNAITNFTGSESWAKKFAGRNKLKMSGARVKELARDDINQYHTSLKQMSARIMQAGPAYEEVANLLQQASVKLLEARSYCTSGRRNTSYVNAGGRRTTTNLAPAQLAQPSQQAPTHIAPAPTYRPEQQQQQQQHQQHHQYEGPPMHETGRDNMNGHTPNPVEDGENLLI